METLPVIRDIQSLQTVAGIMVRSGFFKSMQDVDKAFVVIKAGEEMGIPPVASMRQIELVEGQINIRSHLMAAMIKRTDRYDYRVRENTSTCCRIEFFERGESLGISEYTIEEADQAGLVNKTTRDGRKFNGPWQKIPKTMLYNRAMSQGARMFCPDIFLGAIYTEGEMDAAEPLEAEYRDIPMMTPTHEPEPEPVKPKGEPPSDKQLGLLYGLLKQHGVRDGSKSNLVARIFPDGITKREASDAISLLKEKGQLYGTWINSYISLLVEEEQENKQQVASWMKENFGTNNPSGITKEQQHELFAWITGDFGDIPEVQAEQPAEPEQPDSSPASEPNASNWALLVAQVCQGAGVTLDDLTSWAIDRFAPESNYDDMTQLGADAFNQLRGMDLDTIKESVATYAKDDGDRFV